MSLAQFRDSFRLANIMGTQHKIAPLRIPEVNKNYMKDLLERLNKDYERTPDAAILEQTEYQPVFIYCDLQRGGRQHNIIKELIKTKDDGVKSTAWQAYTQDLLEVWETNQGGASYPVALDNKTPYTKPPIYGNGLLARKAHLKGRLYLVRSDMMNVLDIHKQNGTIFKRKLISVIVPYHEELIDNNGVARKSIELTYIVHNVWIYVGKYMHWQGKIDGGYGMHPCKLHHYQIEFKRWIGDQLFYEFKAGDIGRQRTLPIIKSAKELADEFVPKIRKTTLELIEELNGKTLEEIRKEKTNK